MLKKQSILVVLFLCLISGGSYAQIVGTDAFLMAPGIEIGINGNGYEGSQTLPPFANHYRGGIGRLGFVANPQNDGWVNYDGDFFMPGAPENRFGIEVDGVTYYNSSEIGSLIPSFGLSNYQVVDKCKMVDWDGAVGGIDIHMTYKLDTTDYYYSIQVTLTNTTMVDKNNVYFYKSLDPDNNQDIGWGFATVNTIVEQPIPGCPKALVTAEDFNIWNSYMGLGAIGENVRVAFGGFYVDDASMVYDGVGPYVGAIGASNFSDQAIAICHKDDVIPAGGSSTFEFVVVLNEAQVNQAITNLIYFTFEGGPGFAADCDGSNVPIFYGGIEYETDGVVDTIRRCTTEPSLLWVEAPGEVISEYNLAWLDMEDGDTLGIEAYTTVIPGTEADTVHITCFLTLGPCFGGIGLANEYVVITIQSPEIYVPEQGPFCADSILLTDIEVIDTAYVVDAETLYYSVYPDGAFDDTDLWPSDYIKEGDLVYVMVRNGITGCYDVDSIQVEMTEVKAGVDGIAPGICNTDTGVNLNPYLTDADAGGVWVASNLDWAGAINPVTGIFNPVGLAAGTYEFLYIIGEEPCEPDTAVISIDVFESLTAGLDGTTEICSVAGITVDLNALLSGNDPGGSWVEITPTDGAFNAGTGILDASDLEVGVYLFNYISLTAGPCPSDEAIFTINVTAGPTADFTFSPGSVFTDDTEVTFTNTSSGATDYVWDFGDASPTTSVENPIHNFPAIAGFYDITLIASNELGCADTIVAHLKVKESVLFFIPNTFTPDGNAKNDKFKPVFEFGFDPYNFHMVIYNRYGEIVYESYDASAGWDGAYGNKGTIESGVYTWSIEFKELDSDRIQQHTGHVTILK